ncbi:DoxX family protein [Bailinhaonella thermotolerans]|uniref:DoxX family protein n=1 Tax=Bailinhaonella thermotolerans TaxID=1070861 RepID=A0A3A4B1L7_9ACTN|nr:DoxX family protein [Bailinhaonella thermotolerans]RJL31300.1 DoxX family protein [Bailinhaonella thermotolerans]
MNATQMIVILAAAVANVAAAAVDFARVAWIRGNMAAYGIPESWLFPLGAAKAAGALGLLAGIALRPLGLAAALALVLYFAGAVAAVLRARVHSHLVFPGAFLLLCAGALAAFASA